MIDGLPRIFTVVGLLGAGLVAGVFFAFSSFVMAGLRQLQAPQGIAAMQAINRTAPTPWFMSVLFGTAVVAVGLGIRATRHLGAPWASWQIAAACLYLAGIVLTVVYHVPHNDALAALDPHAAGSAAVWSHYLTWWTAWNHVRMGTSLAAAACLTVSLRVR